MKNDKPQILLTNDDGIDSPGLWAAAESLSEIGYVWVAAPREQYSAAGRSMPLSSDGLIRIKELVVNGKEWKIYAVGGSPAQTVQHAIFEIMPTKPDIVVSGIIYGLNLGQGITVSGTVGAAMEAASYEIPALAVSLDTAKEYHLSYSNEIDFNVAAYFTAYFAKQFLNKELDPLVQILKIDLPTNATKETDWEITSLSPVRYYVPDPPKRKSWDEPASLGYKMQEDASLFPERSDVHTVLSKGIISVTPVNLNMTSKVDFSKLKKDLS